MKAAIVTASLQVARREVPADLYRALPGTLDPVLRRVYAARQVQPGDLQASLRDLQPVSSFRGALVAAERLADARERQASVLVVGDFDADGATASALVVTALRSMGLRRVNYLVPNRFEFGYGLSAAVVGEAARQRPDLIITVDNGVTSVAGVARARELGIDVIVTDHHLPGEELPAALVIANPSLPGESFPARSLAGVGVAFYVMAALARELDRRGVVPEAQSRRAVADCLDLVALGTVADLVPLDANNRILVGEGLARIRSGRARPGIVALFAAAGRDPAIARTADLAFGIAPRLNAAGRLTDMSLGIECLLATDAARARRLAVELDALNSTRQDLQARMQEEATGHIEALVARSLTDDHPLLCLYDESWHEGVVGLVAARVKEATGRPALILAPGEEPGMLKGSARSVEGLHIRDLLANVARRVPDLVFGGHAMAAGVRLPARLLADFQAVLAEEAARVMTEAMSRRLLWTDGPLDVADLRTDLAEAIQYAAPWGQAFPEPRFDNEFTVVEQRVLKEAHLKLRVRHPQGGEILDAIAFNCNPPPGAGPGARVRLIYRIEINRYAGRRRTQLVVDHVSYD